MKSLLGFSLPRRKWKSFVIILLVLAPILYDSTTPFQRILGPYVKNGWPFTTFEPYEYQAGMWIRQHFSDSALILSDPYTINLETELTGLHSPYTRRWVDPNEYSADDIQTMQNMRDDFFLSSDPVAQRAFLTGILQKTGAAQALVIINGRTTRWFTSDNLFIVTDAGIRYPVNLTYLAQFSATVLAVPIYEISGRMYVFEVSIDSFSGFVENLPLVLADDYQNALHVWSVEADGVGTIGVPQIRDDNTSSASGNNSLRITPGVGTNANWRVFTSYVSAHLGPQDWSQQTVLAFYWYGLGTGKKLRVSIATGSDSWTDTLRFDLKEDWKGWKKIVLILSFPTSQAGTPDLTRVTRLGFTMFDNASGTRWLDRVLLDFR